MDERGKGIQIVFNFGYRTFYTLIAIIILLIISVGVYAFSGNVGHTSDQIDEIDPKVLAFAKTGTMVCSGANLAIKSISSDGTVTCETDDVGGHGDGTNCGNGQYARGVDANGNAQACTSDTFCTISEKTIFGSATLVTIACPTSSVAFFK